MQFPGAIGAGTAEYCNNRSERMTEHRPDVEEEEPVERTPVEARQGSRNRLNLRVLVLSLGFAFLILALLYLFFFPTVLD